MVQRPRGRPRQGLEETALEVRFSPETRAWIKQVAQLGGNSEAAVVRMLIDDYRSKVNEAVDNGMERMSRDAD